MKKVILLTFIGVFVILSSCKKTYDVEMNQEIKVSIQGYVYDEATTTPIGNAAVNWPGGSTTTDETGYFSMGSAAGGSLSLTFSADSFASLIETVYIDLSLYSGNTYTETVVIYMPKLDQTLNTTVYQQLGGLYIPASNVPYQIDLGYMFLDRIITGTTDAVGNISQGNLPDRSVELRVDFEKDGVKYGLDTYYGYIYGVPSQFSAEVIVEEKSSQGLLYITATNIFDDEGMPLENFARGDDISINFSASVDLDYNMHTVNLYKDSYTLVATDITWSNDNQNLTIDPIGDSLDVGGSYYVELRLMSENGSYLNNYSYYQQFQFMVESESQINELAKVGTIALIYPTIVVDGTSYIEISFDEVSGANQYEVFGQYKNGEYLELDNIYDWITGDGIVESGYIYLTYLPGIEVPPGGLFSDGATYRIIVRALDSNNDIYGPFSDPLVITAD